MQHDSIARSIGLRVRTGRKRLGITRKQLAQAAAVSERYLNELEHGEANASVGILIKVADALGQDFASLVAASEASATASTSPQHAAFSTLVSAMSPAELAGAVPVLEAYLAERRAPSRGIALLGLRGAGKSTLGRRLAERLAVPFVSVTREIETRAGMSLSDLFNLGGPDAYRTLENEVVADVSRRDDRIVLETAGGIVGNAEALDVILAAFRSVWLTASPEEHLARVASQGDTRPMRGNPKALEHLKAMLAARAQAYARAECRIDTSGRSIEESLADLEAVAVPILASRAT